MQHWHIMLIHHVYVCKVNQKDICIVPKQDIQFHVRMEKSHLLDVGLKFHPQHFSSVVKTISSMILTCLALTHIYIYRHFHYILDNRYLPIVLPWKYNYLIIHFPETSASLPHQIIVHMFQLVLIYLFVQKRYIILPDTLSFQMWKPMGQFPNFSL